jgi:solute:Na+ symporter, SSS family
MVISFLVAAYLHFVHARLGFAPLDPTVAFVTGVVITTLGWLAVTLLTPPTDRAVLQVFYDKIRPAPAGWQRAVDTSGGEGTGNIAASFLAWFLGCLFVYATIFATGYILYGRLAIGLLPAAPAVTSAFGLRQVISDQSPHDRVSY